MYIFLLDIAKVYFLAKFRSRGIAALFCQSRHPTNPNIANQMSGVPGRNAYPCWSEPAGDRRGANNRPGAIVIDLDQELPP
jgi:hypothetical protein